ncbi:MAG: TonB-dependent receptor plug domain-containing protein [Tepidisphaerales bacterium]
MTIPIVVAAGKREQTQRQAAASVSVVTDDEIDLFGYRNIADVLRAQRGFYVYTDGLNWFAGVRGFLRPGEWNARILTLVDGRPTRENVYNQTHLDQDFVVPMEAIKRVEIIRGPGSALYGGNAVFGVVNVVTKDGADLRGGQVRVEGGTSGTARTSLLYGTKTESGWDIIGSFSAYSSRGTTDIIYDGVNDAAHNYGHIENADDEAAVAGFLKIRKGDFTAAFDLETRERDNRSATYLASFFDPGSMHEDRNNVTLSYDHDFAKGQSLHAKVWYGHYAYRQNLTYAANPSTSTPAYGYDMAAGDDWLGQEVHYDWQISSQFHLLAGAEATEALYTVQRDRDDLHGQIVNQGKSYNTWGLFAEGEWKAANWLTLVAGVRLDQVQRLGAQVCPRAAVLVTPDKADTVKLLYGRAFRPPNLYEMFYGAPGYNAPNPDLTAEVIDTYEVVWERQFTDGLRTSLGGFYWSMADAMSDVGIGGDTIQTQNGDPVRAYGIEAEVQRRWASGASVRVHGALTRAEDDQGNRLTHSPEWIAGASLVVPVFNSRTFLAIEPQIVGPMTSDLGESTDPTFITNIVFTAREPARVKGLEVQLGLYNLFANDARLPHNSVDIHYQPTLNYPETELMLNISYRF